MALYCPDFKNQYTLKNSLEISIRFSLSHVRKYLKKEEEEEEEKMVVAEVMVVEVVAGMDHQHLYPVYRQS